jgi:multidrug efflux pump
VISVFGYFGENNNGVEFFVESEPEQAIVYVRARGNLSLEEKDALVLRAEKIVLAHPGIDSAFAFAGEGGLGNNTGGAQPPKDTIGQIQIETIPWEDRKDDPALDGDLVLEQLKADLEQIPGIKIEVLNLAMGPASGKPVHLRLKGDNWEDLLTATETARAKFDATPGLTLIEDTRPLPGIDWQIDVDVEKAGRYGADVATVGAMVQLVTRGILLDTMRVDSSDEEIEIRVRLPEDYRVLSTLDTLKVRTADGLIPLANFVSRKPVEKLAQIDRIDQSRYFDVKADVVAGLVMFSEGADKTPLAYGLEREDGRFEEAGKRYEITQFAETRTRADLSAAQEAGSLHVTGVNENERIAGLTEWLETNPLPADIAWEWTGDQEDQAESMAFLGKAFLGALFLMFIILLAQFNSFYNSVLVLLAVVLSTTGVLIGMLVMDQSFSVIMTGTGIVALAGIVVNNNIVLIDTYQEYSQYMPRIEAIVRTAESRLRPVLLTTITTMAGLAPMMFGLSLDFGAGGYTVDSPTALWWKQLATAVVFGLGIATVLTLVLTPALLAFRVWFVTYVVALLRLFGRLFGGGESRLAKDWALRRAAKKVKSPEILWEDDPAPNGPSQGPSHLRAAE